MIPSTNTWYSSTKYATFTEECAISTHDSKGWKFVDTVKPRIFQTRASDPSGSLIPSKISLLTNSLKYDNKDSVRIERACIISDVLLSRNYSWKNIIGKYSIPVGLPQFLGGLNHPIGLTENYLSTISDSDIKVIIGLNLIDPLLGLPIIWQDENGEIDEDLSSTISLLIESIKDSVESEDLSEVDGTKFNIENHITRGTGERYSDYLTRCETFKSENNLISIHEFVSSIITGLRQRDILLNEDFETPIKKSYTSIRNRLLFLRSHFESVKPEKYDITEVSVWKIKERVLEATKKILFKKNYLDTLVNKDSLPSFLVSFH